MATISDKVLGLNPVSVSGSRPEGEVELVLNLWIGVPLEGSGRLRWVVSLLDAAQAGRAEVERRARFSVEFEVVLREGVSAEEFRGGPLAEELSASLWPHAYAMLNSLCGMLQIPSLPLPLSSPWTAADAGDLEAEEGSAGDQC